MALEGIEMHESFDVCIPETQRLNGRPLSHEKASCFAPCGGKQCDVA